MITRHERAAARQAQTGDSLLHPVPLLALAALVLNDHVLKAAFPGFVTGKLSDVAGVALLPLVLVAGWELFSAATGRVSRARGRVLLVALLVTGAGFAAVKLVPQGAEAFGWLLGAVQWPVASLTSLAAGHGVVAPVAAPIVADPTDLLALPALALAAWVGVARVRRSPTDAMATDRRSEVAVR